jgi:hypothetical protein
MGVAYGTSYNITRAIRKVTSSELLTKQAVGKKLCVKNTYMLKLILNVGTCRIRV